jgi:aminoglycoside phosphotransferase (APT) family kinase protein
MAGQRATIGAMGVGGEEPLAGGWLTAGVVRVGDTVRRPTGPHTPAVHALLRHLEAVSFDGAPPLLGIDDEGREVLGYVPGAVRLDAAQACWPDEALREAVRLLRAFHDATAAVAGPAAEVICHGDPGPWNIVWRDDRAVALIDFDEIHPGRRRDDLGDAAWKHLNLGSPVAGDAEQERRLRLFADAAGLSREGLLAGVRHALAREEEALRRLALDPDALAFRRARLARATRYVRASA